jgi:hypothetical protein
MLWPEVCRYIDGIVSLERVSDVRKAVRQYRRRITNQADALAF